MVKKESLKKAKVRAKWHLQTMHISALQQFWLRGEDEDYLDQLSLVFSLALSTFYC